MGIRVNLLPILVTAVSAAIGYLINGVTGAVWGFIIWASLSFVFTAYAMHKRDKKKTFIDHIADRGGR